MNLIKTFLCLIFLCTLTSCIYRMPAEDEFSCQPLTNNPNITHDKGKLCIPGLT